MSILVQVSDAFYNVCTFLANGIQGVTDGINFIIQLNYNLVSTTYTVVHSVVSVAASFALKVWNVLYNVFTYLLDFTHECVNFISLTLYFVWKGFVSVFNFVDLTCVKVVSFFTCCAHYLSQIYLTMKQAAVDIYEGVFFLYNFVVDTFTIVVMSIFLFLTSIGSGCVNFVTGVWQGLGYVLSSVAYFPIYCMECVESAKEQVTKFIIHAITFTPKETYLGIICLCLLYFMLSNTFRYLSCHGMPLFSNRMRMRRGQRFDWQFDRGFESDFEDLYNSDTEDRVWRNNHSVTADSDESDGQSESEDSNRSSDSHDSGTVDNDLSDDDDVNEGDDDSDDSRTVVTEDSDSDASLNSHTFSTESSDHEIEVQLPNMDERYSLRSRSSTPSRQPNPLNSPEEFDREMEKERDKRKCVVCQDQIKSVLVLPCRHMCMCVDCADHIVRSRFVGRRVCPLCRTRIQKVMNVFV